MQEEFEADFNYDASIIFLFVIVIVSSFVASFGTCKVDSSRYS